ncbi:MAG: diguanylate cyclase [Hyphomicrobiales bacterium]|nr:MAG: diguanylate cyclase [Hyphomicrobiales bacterium]
MVWSSSARLKASLQDVVFIALLVFAAALFGILTRPIGFLSAFWPANALLLGVMLRQPELSTPQNWLAAFGGFVAADMLTGSELGVTLWLTAANVAGALTGWLVLRGVPAEHHRLSRPSSIFYLLGGSVAAAIAAAAVGLWVAPDLLGTDRLRGFAFWSASELVNYIIILPVVLTAPGLLAVWQRLRGAFHWRPMLPALSLGASIIASTLIGGPGSLAIPVPALLWCALSYSLFTTSILTVVLGGWLMIGFTDGFVAMATLTTASAARSRSASASPCWRWRRSRSRA